MELSLDRSLAYLWASPTPVQQGQAIKRNDRLEVVPCFERPVNFPNTGGSVMGSMEMKAPYDL